MKNNLILLTKCMMMFPQMTSDNSRTESSGHALSQDLNGWHSSVTLLVDHGPWPCYGTSHTLGIFKKSQLLAKTMPKIACIYIYIYYGKSVHA